MEEKYLKTTWQQRLIAVLVGIALLGSTLFAYVMLIMNKGEMTPPESPEVAKLKAEYTEKVEKLDKLAKKLSDRHFERFMAQKAKVRSFNASTANAAGIQKNDLEEGEGEELKEGEVNYYAYYIGVCPDETIFDSSFNDPKKPTALKAPIQGKGLIKGWVDGVVGMKIGGVREITMPGELAYGETREICGMKNAPLRFIVMAIRDEEFKTAAGELEALQYKLVQLQRKDKKAP